ncbi:MAG: peptidoglycan-binding protein [Spirochaetales bacterium]|nr:peptidoglycan-binding protein [Spirochaetales bacterium]
MTRRCASIVIVFLVFGAGSLFAQIPHFKRSLFLTDPRMNGADVTAAQQRLRSLGYDEVGEADGWFGPMTGRAVGRFQFRMGLAVKGAIDARTWEALFSEGARSGKRPTGGKPALIGCGGYLLGGWSDRGWLEGPDALDWYDEDGPFPVRFYGREAFLTQGSCDVSAAPFDAPYADSPRLSAARAPGYAASELFLALTAEHNPFPRGPAAEAADDSGALRKTLAGHLKKHGITVPPDDLTAYTIDLDGDGDMDSIVQSTRYGSDDWAEAPPQSYSCVLYLETLPKGATRLVELAGEYYPEGAGFHHNRFTFEAAADLNGDGSYEILMNARYYEGSFDVAYEVKKGAAQAVLSAGTGV